MYGYIYSSVYSSVSETLSDESYCSSGASITARRENLAAVACIRPIMSLHTAALPRERAPRDLRAAALVLRLAAAHPPPGAPGLP